MDALDVVPKEIVDSLKNLNKVRNDCSHVMDYVISEKDVDRIGSPFGLEYIKLKRKFLATNALLRDTLMILISRFDGTVAGVIDSKNK